MHKVNRMVYFVSIIIPAVLPSVKRPRPKFVTVFDLTGKANASTIIKVIFGTQPNPELSKF